MQNPNFYVVPQEEAGPEKFESIQYMKPQDVTVAKELTIRLGEIFPDGFVRDETGISAEESPDEKIVNAIFTADEVKARFKDAPPEQYVERYYKVQREADALKNSPDPEIARKANEIEDALKYMDLFVKKYEDHAKMPESQIQSLYEENYTYMRSLYDMVVQPGLLMVGRKEANVEKLVAEMAAIEARYSVKKPAVTSLYDVFFAKKHVPPETVLNYNEKKIRQFS